MPTIAFKSRVQTSSEHCTLTLVIRHCLVVGLPSQTVHTMKLSLPDAVDVLLASQLLITISGMLNGARIPPGELLDSCIARHLLEYLRLNAHELGINAVSETYISGDTGMLTFSCTGSRPFPTANDTVRTTLVGFDLDYIWQVGNKATANKKVDSQATVKCRPFSRRVLSLPYLTAVNNVIERFVIFQLVKRYPLIFGSWCQQLDVEARFFNSISGSIARIATRSPNLEFQRKCNALLKLCRQKSRSLSSFAVATLTEYSEILGATSTLETLSSNSQTSSIVTSMETFYRLGLKRPLFKVTSNLCVPEEKEDAILLDHDALPSFFEEHHFYPEDEEMISSLDFLDQLFEPEQNLPSVLPHVVSFSKECLRDADDLDDFSPPDVADEKDEDAVFEFRDEVGSESPSSWYGTATELDLEDANISGIYHNWFGVDQREGSQEKFNYASMGPPNIDDLQPPNLPSLRLARSNEIDLDPICIIVSSDHGFRALDLKLTYTAKDSDGEGLFSDDNVADLQTVLNGNNFDAKEIFRYTDTPTAFPHFDYDSGTDSMSLDQENTRLGLECPPDAVALSLGNNSTVIVERHERGVPIIIEDFEDNGSSIGKEQQPLITHCTYEQAGSPVVPDECGFFAIDFD